MLCFCFVFLCCAPCVASFSGLSFFDRPFGILWCLIKQRPYYLNMFHKENQLRTFFTTFDYIKSLIFDLHVVALRLWGNLSWISWTVGYFEVTFSFPSTPWGLAVFTEDVRQTLIMSFSVAVIDVRRGSIDYGNFCVILYALHTSIDSIFSLQL